LAVFYVEFLWSPKRSTRKTRPVKWQLDQWDSIYSTTWRLGPQDMSAKRIGKQQRPKNKYYMLPLLIGDFGRFAFLYRKDPKRFWVMLLAVFVSRDLALKVYLNERVFEPRERDYALGWFVLCL
jgi:hypothetical protein